MTMEKPKIKPSPPAPPPCTGEGGRKIRRVAVAIDPCYPLRHHYELVVGIQHYAREHADWDLTVEPFIRMLPKAEGKSGYHGVIGRATTELAQQAARAGIPLVNVWTGSPVTTLPSVLPDARTCGRTAAEHLLSRGFRRFAFQGFLRHAGTQLAWDGFNAVLRAKNCRCTTQRISPQRDENAKRWDRYSARLGQWIGSWKPPIGVFVVQDTLGPYLAYTCQRAGLRIPEDVAVISLGNEPAACVLWEPTLSSFDLGYDRVGYEAAKLLDRLMDGEPASKEPIFVPPKELVVRRSTDVCLVSDPLVTAALRFIAEQSHKGIRGEDVALHVHATEPSLRRHFLAVLGCTVTDEIARLRLERAKRLLVENDKPIKEVALDCGFTNAAHFRVGFLQAEGMSPGKYRRCHGGKKDPGARLRSGR